MDLQSSREVITMSLRQRTRSAPAGARRAIVLAAGLLLAVASLPLAAAPVDAATYTVRLEAGSQSGYTFSSSGAILTRKTVTLTAPTTAVASLRHAVPPHGGYFFRLTSGPLAGYEVRESLLAHVPGKIADVPYSPAARISFPAGRYIGYRFDESWGLAGTKPHSLASASSASASRRAVIDGRRYVLISNGLWAGYWIPVTVGAPTTGHRISCSVGAKVAPGSTTVYRRVATSDRQVALTFDMGGRLVPAVDIMERLIIDRVCATIFPTGDAAVTTDGRAVMALVKANPFLFELANHTQNHCNLRDGGGGASCPTTPPSDARIRAELLDAEAVFVQLTGRGGAPYWRPPYGAYDTRVRTAAASAGFTQTIMWDIDTIDWRATADDGPTAASMTSKVLANAQPGSIVLMHLGGWHTYDALPSMVNRLRNAKLEPTTITSLLRPG